MHKASIAVLTRANSFEILVANVMLLEFQNHPCPLYLPDFVYKKTVQPQISLILQIGWLVNCIY